MPIYTYYCKPCDKDFEKMSKIDERDNQKCDDCGYRLFRSVDIPGGVWAPTSGKGLA
jgi:putative FmdB family regulatory protein